jgi:site-specific recombinase XerC
MPVSDDVVDRHLAELAQRRRSEGTIYARRRALARMAAAIGVPLLRAAPDDLTEWLDDLEVIDNTIVHYASHARCFYRWAVRKRLVDVNPMDEVIVPVLVRGLPRPISEEDLMRAIAGAPQPIRIWLVLAGWAGLRCCEIAPLRRENVLDTATPPVLLIAPDATKGRRGRIVPLCSFAVAELHLAGMPRAGYIFRRADGRPGANRPAVISHATAAYLHESGIDATIHQARHRFGTKTYQAKKDLRLVQDLMGHADPATTAGYAAYCQADGIDAVEALPVPARLRAVGE